MGNGTLKLQTRVRPIIEAIAQVSNLRTWLMYHQRALQGHSEICSAIKSSHTCMRVVTASKAMGISRLYTRHFSRGCVAHDASREPCLPMMCSPARLLKPLEVLLPWAGGPSCFAPIWEATYPRASRATLHSAPSPTVRLWWRRGEDSGYCADAV
jgi:hypothetical protein